MKLRVGPYLYHVRVVPGYIRHEGRDCLGLCDNETHELLISDVPGPAQRVQVVCHEYLEAWLYHFGHDMIEHPAKEAICDLMGMAMTQFTLDFIHTIRQMDRGEIESMLDDAAFEHAQAQSHVPQSMPSLRMREHVTDSGHAPDDGAWRVRVFEAASFSPSPRPATASQS
jgi:hypothetical protein